MNKFYLRLLAERNELKKLITKIPDYQVIDKSCLDSLLQEIEEKICTSIDVAKISPENRINYIIDKGWNFQMKANRGIELYINPLYEKSQLQVLTHKGFDDYEECIERLAYKLSILEKRTTEEVLYDWINPNLSNNKNIKKYIKVDVKDLDIFRQIPLENINFYLFSKGWVETESIEGKAIIWEKNSNGIRFELLCPIKESFGDYAQRVYDLVIVLENQEVRSQVEIISSLYKSKFDPKEHKSIEIKGIVTRIGWDEDRNISSIIVSEKKGYSPSSENKYEIVTDNYDYYLIAHDAEYPLKKRVLVRGTLLKGYNLKIVDVTDFKIIND